MHINKYGLHEHYRGLSAILLRNGPANVLFFGLREPLRESFPRGVSGIAIMTNDFICGAMLGAVISTICFPLNGKFVAIEYTCAFWRPILIFVCCVWPELVARTRMQSIYGERFIGVGEALYLTYQERGHNWWRLYRGVHMNFIRSLLSWGIINSAYEKLKSIT